MLRIWILPRPIRWSVQLRVNVQTNPPLQQKIQSLCLSIHDLKRLPSQTAEATCHSMTTALPEHVWPPYWLSSDGVTRTPLHPPPSVCAEAADRQAKGWDEAQRESKPPPHLLLTQTNEAVGGWPGRGMESGEERWKALFILFKSNCFSSLGRSYGCWIRVEVSLLSGQNVKICWNFFFVFSFRCFFPKNFFSL